MVPVSLHLLLIIIAACCFFILKKDIKIAQIRDFMYLSYIVIVQLAYGLHEGEEVHPAAAVDTGTHLHSDRVIEALSFNTASRPV